MNPLTVSVLMGGGTREHAVSLDTGTAVADALDRRGHAVRRHEVPDAELEGVLAAGRDVDVVFIALHGGAGEDGRVQAAFDLAGIPYVGSGPGPSAVAMDKIWTKQIARSLGVPVATDAVLAADAGDEGLADAILTVGFPCVLKPVAEGSAVGVTICPDVEALQAAWAAREPDDVDYVVETYVPGRELTVPILWGEPTDVIEIRPREGFYDYRNKYTAGCTEYDCPADVPASVASSVASHALRLYRALHLRDMARVDFRLDPDDRPFLLEANTIPGMTGTSLLPMGAARTGIDFDELCDRLCRVAAARGSRP